MITAKKRFEVLKRDDFRCQYCWRNGKDVTLEVDHIVPKSKSGDDDINNLITCCRECNSGKWSSLMDDCEWIVAVKIKEHEKETIKEFFSVWNEWGYWEINKNNVAFITGFIKSYYTNQTVLWYVKSELVDKIWRWVWEWKITLADFKEWGGSCDICLWERDTFIWENDLFRILEDAWEGEHEDGLWNSWTWNTDDHNIRINLLLSKESVWQGHSMPFILKYTQFPKHLRMWDKEKHSMLN